MQKVWNRKIVRTGKAAGWLGVVYSWYYTLTTQLVDWCWVDNVSMEPTLYHGDIVILRPVGYSWINAVEYKDIKVIIIILEMTLYDMDTIITRLVLKLNTDQHC